ncbi:cytidine deaminase, partial [Listeria monocytogenes]|nr:cytidine deaminase [Listeria monocytogenes]
PDMPVILTNLTAKTATVTVKELLPGAFTSDDML